MRVMASSATKGNRAAISAESQGGATCKAGNGDNVVGWGKIGGDSVGWTCLWWDGSGAVIRKAGAVCDGRPTTASATGTAS